MKKQSLIIFTRYPEAGKTKTRMIPLLGKEGAAKVQGEMTEYIVNKFSKLQEQNIEINIYFTGGNEDLMQQWLGNNFIYKLQSEGDLGHRMKTAFIDIFNNNVSQAIIIGIDCPEITIEILEKGFTLLEQNHDLILGEAQDGGYYLIGLNKIIPELFDNIKWGSPQVLQETINIAQNLNLNYYLLPPLNDIDRPEDLHIWEKFKI